MYTLEKKIFKLVVHARGVSLRVNIRLALEIVSWSFMNNIHSYSLHIIYSSCASITEVDVSKISRFLFVESKYYLKRIRQELQNCNYFNSTDLMTLSQA